MTTHIRLGVGTLATALLLAGCSPTPEDPLPPPPAATITAFTVNPKSVDKPGDAVTLSWATENATSVSIEQLGVGPLAGVSGASGTATATVTANAVFVLTARGEGGTDARAAGVSVAHEGGAVLFSALPGRITAGETASLVWYAPGAGEVTLTGAGGAPVDLGGQLESGVVEVKPDATTTWQLTVDGQTYEATVDVAPALLTFSLDGAAPAPGGDVSLAWTTRGATRLTLRRAGESAALLEETDAARIAAGAFTEPVPAGLGDGAALVYTLTIEGGGHSESRALTVRVGAIGLEIEAPGFVTSGQSVLVSWTSTGADALAVYVDGTFVYAPSSRAQVDAGSFVFVNGGSDQTVELVATALNGAEARVTHTVETVGRVTFNTFTATPDVIATGGESVTLSWDVTNARHVRISQVGGAFATEKSGLQDTGSVEVYPNRPTVSYRLEADNQAGDAITAQVVTVTVTTPGVITVSQQLPAGATTTITGSTLPGATGIAGVPLVSVNRPQESFVDISADGVEVTGFVGNGSIDPLDQGSALIDVGNFSMPINGVASGPTLAISTDGWMIFSANNDAHTASGGSSRPGAMQVYAADLSTDTNGHIYYRFDTTNGVRRLIVQWSQVPYWASPTTTSYTFQAQLYETGKVVFAYGSMVGSTTATVGFVTASGTRIAPPSTPVSNTTLSFFYEAPFADGPVTITVPTTPIYLMVSTPNGPIEALLDAELTPGRAWISEVNPRPATGLTGAQWVELTNRSTAPFPLDGWTLKSGTQSFVIPAGSTIAPGAQFLLAQSSDLGDGASVAVDLALPGTFTLAATGSIDLIPPGTTTAYARLTWTTALAATPGRSVQADAPQRALPLVPPTCAAPTASTYGDGAQVGTPGAPQPRCMPYVLEQLPTDDFETLGGNPSATLLVAAGTGSDTAVFTVPLPQPVPYFGAPASTLYVSTNGWLTTTATTNAGTTNKSMPSSTTPVGLIAPFWDDNAGDTSIANSGMYWLQRDPDGVPDSGDEVTIVSWEAWRYWSSTYDGQYLDFQVKLFANGDIEFHYGRQTAGTYSTGSSATTWLESPDGLSVVPINVNTAGGITGHTAYRYSYQP